MGCNPHIMEWVRAAAHAVSLLAWPRVAAPRFPLTMIHARLHALLSGRVLALVAHRGWCRGAAEEARTMLVAAPARPWPWPEGRGLWRSRWGRGGRGTRTGGHGRRWGWSSADAWSMLLLQEKPRNGATGGSRACCCCRRSRETVRQAAAGHAAAAGDAAAAAPSPSPSSSSSPSDIALCRHSLTT
jgi:hypothetical protein